MEGKMRCECNVMDENPLFVLQRVCPTTKRDIRSTAYGFAVIVPTGPGGKASFGGQVKRCQGSRTRLV